MSEPTSTEPTMAWADNEIKALRKHVARLESVLETTRALSDQRATELIEVRARLHVLEEFWREANLPE